MGLLILMYMIYTVWWMVNPLHAIKVFVQKNISCQDCQQYRVIIFMTRFVAVYLFLVALLCGNLYYMHFIKYPDNKIISELSSLSLLSFVPTSIIAAILYCNMSTTTDTLSTPLIPTKYISIINLPFIIAICHVFIGEKCISSTPLSYPPL